MVLIKLVVYVIYPYKINDINVDEEQCCQLINHYKRADYDNVEVVLLNPLVAGAKSYSYPVFIHFRKFKIYLLLNFIREKAKEIDLNIVGDGGDGDVTNRKYQMDQLLNETIQYIA